MTNEMDHLFDSDPDFVFQEDYQVVRYFFTSFWIGYETGIGIIFPLQRANKVIGTIFPLFKQLHMQIARDIADVSRDIKFEIFAEAGCQIGAAKLLGANFEVSTILLGQFNSNSKLNLAGSPLTLTRGYLYSNILNLFIKTDKKGVVLIIGANTDYLDTKEPNDHEL